MKKTYVLGLFLTSLVFLICQSGRCRGVFQKWNKTCCEADFPVPSQMVSAIFSFTSNPSYQYGDLTNIGHNQYKSTSLQVVWGSISLLEENEKSQIGGNSNKLNANFNYESGVMDLAIISIENIDQDKFLNLHFAWRNLKSILRKAENLVLGVELNLKDLCPSICTIGFDENNRENYRTINNHKIIYLS